MGAASLGYSIIVIRTSETEYCFIFYIHDRIKILLIGEYTLENRANTEPCRKVSNITCVISDMRNMVIIFSYIKVILK